MNNLMMKLGFYPGPLGTWMDLDNLSYAWVSESGEIHEGYVSAREAFNAKEGR